MAVHYFQTFPQLLDLHISHVREIRPMTFERILQLMLDSDQKDFVIDVHGSAKGLSIPLARGTEICGGQAVPGHAAANRPYTAGGPASGG